MDVVAKMFNDLESSDLKEVEENKTKLIESFSQSKLPGHFIYNTVASIAWNYHGKDCSPGTKTFFSPHAHIHTPFTSKNWNQLSNDLTSLFAFFLPAFLSRLFFTQFPGHLSCLLTFLYHFVFLNSILSFFLLNVHNAHNDIV